MRIQVFQLCSRSLSAAKDRMNYGQSQFCLTLCWWDLMRIHRHRHVFGPKLIRSPRALAHAVPRWNAPFRFR